jgi:serine/threonine-protein kinase
VSNQPPPNNPTLPGQILAGKYRVERIIGQGGMGVVVEAKHIALDERVALKFLLPDYALNPEASGRFQREARAAAKIKSEHVARVSDVGTLETGAPYMVMEFLEGNDLSKHLETQGVLMVPDAVDYVIQGCEALCEAHGHGIVHRDIKPANLFLTKRSNGSPLVKLLDFGISKVSGGGIDNLTKTTTAMGSALYMSPEQMQTTRGVDHRTDIYAMGISLYELLAGKQPFYADTLPQLCAEIFTGVPTPIRTLRQDVPEELAQVMEKAYARDRAHRHQSIGELVIALAPFAPSRSWPTIEGVARMAGLEPPVQGARPVPMAQGGTQIIGQPLGPPGAPQALTTSDPSTMRSSGPPMGSAPMGSAPPMGGLPPTTGPGVSVISGSMPAARPASKMPMVLGVLGVLAVLGAVAFFGMRSVAKPAVAATPPTETAPVVTAPPAETAPPVVTATAAPPVPSADPAAPTTTTAAPSAPPTGPTVAVGPRGKAPAVPAKTPAIPAKTPAAKAPGKATDVGF